MAFVGRILQSMDSHHCLAFVYPIAGILCEWLCQIHVKFQTSSAEVRVPALLERNQIFLWGERMAVEMCDEGSRCI